MLNKTEIRLTGITVLGGLLEYYDFIIFALMAGYLANQFFPVSDPYTSLLITFSTFAAGYLSRPLGGLLFGHLGDRYGRKCTFAITVLIMALSTILIGCLPSYTQIGIWAPILLTLLRIIQGVSIGGEIPGALTLLSEGNQKHMGLVISLLMSGLLTGLLLGYFVHSMLAQGLDEQRMQDWGWRVPFWFGGALGIFSFFIRRHVHESQLFLELDSQKLRQQIPILVLIKSHKKAILTGILLIAPASVVMSLLFLFSQTYLTQLLHYDARPVTLAGCAGLLTSIAVSTLWGYMADDNRSRVMAMIKLNCLFLTLSAIPIFSAYADYHASPYTVAFFSSLLLGSLLVINPLSLSTLFPVHIRYSGIAFSYNVCLATFGGLAPIIAMALIKITGNLSSPAYYLVLSGFCGLLACYLLKQQPDIGKCSIACDPPDQPLFNSQPDQ